MNPVSREYESKVFIWHRLYLSLASHYTLPHCLTLTTPNSSVWISFLVSFPLLSHSNNCRTVTDSLCFCLACLVSLDPRVSFLPYARWNIQLSHNYTWALYIICLSAIFFSCYGRKLRLFWAALELWLEVIYCEKVVIIALTIHFHLHAARHRFTHVVITSLTGEYGMKIGPR